MIMSRLLSLLILIICSPLLIVIGISIKMSSSGPILHWSKRYGLNKTFFYMPKLRTMRLNTPDVATHLLENSNEHITSIGKILRKFSIDEIPQFYSVIKGDMSLVGPRPALHNQNDLIEKRDSYNINSVKPGITGWAQINGRDDISINEKILYEIEYMKKKSIFFDTYIIFITIFKIFKNDSVKH